LPKYRFDETALRWVGTVPAVAWAAVRIILAILGVVLFGAVAVTASVSPPPVASPAASPTVTPRFTPLPVVETPPPDFGERLSRSYGRFAGMFSLPIEGADIPIDPELLPGAPRDYRAGMHEGIDFPAATETPVLAAASGTVTRVDVSFVDWTVEQEEIALNEALALGYTPAATLDRIRGRQVWIEHGKGVSTRYAHLFAVEPLVVGQPIQAGTRIGAVGSSGYPQGGPHLHFEVRVGDYFYGDGLSGDALVRAVSRLFR
jgi:murein DD-endopeptidase MepM/ murein hydrolase activator NlpD